MHINEASVESENMEHPLYFPQSSKKTAFAKTEPVLMGLPQIYKIF